MQVLSCKVSRLPGPERQSRGFAFIEYEHPDDAAAAIKGLDKTMLGDRSVFCLPYPLFGFICLNFTGWSYCDIT
jgi:RNA recognition motif-containing protein